MQIPVSWQYDEFRQVGKDYADLREVEHYDASHALFRDIRAESNQILDRLGTKPGDYLIDIGSGTGTFAIEAARRGAKVLAVDISEAMLERSRAKAIEEAVPDIDFRHAGFLTCAATPGSADTIVSIFSLHHLPDFWKGIALKRMSSLLKPGGRFFLRDVILEESEAIENIKGFIDAQAAIGGDFLREDAEMHFRDEFSTYDWVIEGLLARAGFAIEFKQIEKGLLGTFLCTRN